MNTEINNETIAAAPNVIMMDENTDLVALSDARKARKEAIEAASQAREDHEIALDYYLDDVTDSDAGESSYQTKISAGQAYTAAAKTWGAFSCPDMVMSETDIAFVDAFEAATRDIFRAA